MTKYIVAVFGLLLLIATGTAIWYRGTAANAKREADKQKVIADAATARANNLQFVLDIERAATAAMATIGVGLEQKNSETEDLPNIIVADLRADRLRLQKHWASCQTDLSKAATPSGERDETARSREESAGRIVRITRDSDNQLAACQATVKFYEDFYKQALPQ